MFLPTGNLLGHKLLPDTFPVAATFCIVLKEPVFSRDLITCHALSSAEIAV